MIKLELKELDTKRLYTREEINNFPGGKLTCLFAAVYFIFNENKELIYIGKTKRLRPRLQQHFRKSNYQDKLDIGFRTGSRIPVNESCYFDYVPFKKEEILNLKMIEEIYINYYKPKYNSSFY